MSTGIFHRLKTHVSARMAAARHGRPARKMRVILVIGQDGTPGTVAYLSSILRADGSRVGVVTQQYVEIAGERASGSDQADITGDVQRLQALLAQMRRARCTFAIIEVPTELPEHQFIGIDPNMIIIRRCGDDYTDPMTIQARLAMLGNILNRRPQLIAFNRDDPCGAELAHLSGTEGVISFGTHQKTDCRITDVTLHPKGSAIALLVDHQTTINLATVMTGKRAIYNATAAAAAAYVLQIPIESIERGVLDLPSLPGQLEVIPLQRPYQIVFDAATTPGGIAETIETLKHFTKNRLIIVFGSPLDTTTAMRPRLGEIVARNADRLVITDGEFSAEQSAAQIREQLLQGVSAVNGDAKTDEIADRRQAIEKAVSIARRGDTILIAASTQRAYRHLGTERLPWSDRKVIEELFES